LIKKNWVYILFAFSLLVFIATKLIHTDSRKGISLKTIRNKTGWGYQILVNDSLYINQEYIPTIEGYKAFATENDAEKVGQLMINKMKRNYKMLPSVTIQELDSCGIQR